MAGLAARLYLGGAGAPRRYFAWGQAVRGAVLALLLVHAVPGLGLVRCSWPGRHRLIGWLRAARAHTPPSPPASGRPVWYVPATPGS